MLALPRPHALTGTTGWRRLVDGSRAPVGNHEHHRAAGVLSLPLPPFKCLPRYTHANMPLGYCCGSPRPELPLSGP